VSPPTFALVVTTPRPGEPVPVAVTVTGDIDVTNADEFVAAVEDIDAPRPVIVDLDHLRFLDSAGFAALDRLLGDRAVVLVLNPGSPVHAAAMLMGLPCHDSVAAAVAAMARS
jgi:anti-sigma B factor antagonist